MVNHSDGACCKQEMCLEDDDDSRLFTPPKKLSIFTPVSKLPLFQAAPLFKNIESTQDSFFT
jgi:hypothetical protein